MADEIVLKVVLESDLAEKSVGDLKQDFKDLTNQINNTKIGTKEYKDTLQSLGVVKGGLQDLKQQIQALNPEKTLAAVARVGSSVASGFAAAQGAAALFGGESEDLMKVLVRVQAATALASGLQGLAGMGKALQTAGMAMEAFALSNPFTAIAAAVVALVAVTYTAVKSFDDSATKADELRKSNEDLELSMKNLKDETDLTERKMRALGKSEQEIFEFRQKARNVEIENLQFQIKNINKLQRLDKETAEDLKKRNELEDRINVLRKTREVEELEFHKKNAEEAIKQTDKASDDADTQAEKDKKRGEKAVADKEHERIKALQETARWDAEHTKQHQDFLGAAAAMDKDAADKAEQAAETADRIQLERALKHGEKRKKQKEDEIAHEKKLQENWNKNKLNEAQKTFNQLNGIANLFYANALARAHGDEKKQKEIRKKQFNTNKAFQIAETIINTAKAISNAIADYPYPANIALAVIAGALGTAQTIAIKNTKFDDGGGDSAPSAPDTGGGVGGLGDTSGGGGTSQTVFHGAGSTPVNTNEQGDFTGFGGQGGRQGQGQPIRAYVVETDISSSQKTIRGIEERAQF